MPKPTKEELFVEAFWDAEMESGYEPALAIVSKQFGLSQEDAEKLITEDDELNNGNF